MTRLFLRNCRLTFAGSSAVTIEGGGPKDLQIQASIGASALQTPNPASFSVTNPNQQTIAAFQNKEFQTVTFEAGYDGEYNLLYSGQIKQSLYFHAEDNVTGLVKVFCAEHANPYQQSRVNKTLAAGWTPRDKLTLALDAMKPLGITGLGLCNVDLDSPKYPRGRPFSTMARDLIREIALAKGATWSMHNGQVHIVNPTMPLQTSGPIVLNSRTGLTGWVQQTENGIIARCLLRPEIDINTQVQIDEASINQAEKSLSVDTGFGNIGSQAFDLKYTGTIAADGLYRVAYREIEIDTRGQSYYMTLTCLAIGAILNDAQIHSQLGVGLK